MAKSEETIAAIATPSGRGGIGIIRISGPQSLAIAKAISAKNPKPKEVCYCSFRDENKDLVDKGLLIYFKAPESYTGEDVVELHGHGGPAVLNLLLNVIIKKGARIARPGEYTERAFLNNKMDLLQAEAIADLIDSASEQAVRGAMRSLEGDFSKAVQVIKQEIISIRVYVEGTLDFPDEEIDLITSTELKKKTALCTEHLKDILNAAKKGRVLNEGIKIVIAGPPNAGKSSLLNKLLQTERAIVTDEPGTTRDVIKDRIIIDGVSICLSDTAGIRKPMDKIEVEGINRSYKEIDQADVIVFVTESAITDEQQRLLKDLQTNKNIIQIENKIDLKGTPPQRNHEDGRDYVSLSVKTGLGMDLLYDCLEEVVGLRNSSEDILLARSRHIEALEKAKKYLKQGQRKLETDNAPELFAEDLTKAQQELAKITGEFSSDDLLGEIFSRFCIGK